MELVGACFFIVGVFVFILAKREFQLAETPIPGNKPTTVIIDSGVFRISRNPIYLSFSAIHLAIFFWTENLWLLATFALALIMIGCIVIPREERYLETKFGAGYVYYKHKVRRWL